MTASSIVLYTLVVEALIYAAAVYEKYQELRSIRRGI